MFMSTWTSHRPRRRAPLVLSRSECRLGRRQELTDVEPTVAIHSSRRSCGADAGHWRVGWGSPNLSRGRACRPKTGEAKCEHYLLLPLSPWEWVRWAHRTRLPARPMAQPLRRRLTKRARLSQWLAVAVAAGTAARAADAVAIEHNNPPNASVLDRGSRADVIVGRRFTGVFAKIAATELVSPNPPSSNLHLARIRPL